MGSYYGVIFPEFWTGHTGRELRSSGGKDAQLMALYLATNRFTNMLGLYHLLVDDIKHETGLGYLAISRALTVVRDAAYATYDARTSFVWVKQMARFRLALKPGDALAPKDHRVLAVNRVYQALPANPFLGDFFDMNAKLLRLTKRREDVGRRTDFVVDTNHDHKMSSLQGASKTLVSQ
jgi:hypothetical protein